MPAKPTLKYIHFREIEKPDRDTEQFCGTYFMMVLAPKLPLKHTGYPETTNATDNNKRSSNVLAGTGCKYLSGNNLPRIELIRGKLFPGRYLLPMTPY